MKKRRKVLLFFVEGSTDRDSLIGILEVLFSEASIRFLIMQGDFTVGKVNFTHNIRKNLGELVRSEMKKYGFTQKDMLGLIHLVDTDGVYIPDNCIKVGKGDHICYGLNDIEHPHPQKIIERNKQKRQNLEVLKDTQYLLRSIPYFCFYFSRNLEHVLHNKPEKLSVDEKMDLAIDFSEHFIRCPGEFLELIEDSQLRAPGNYSETWEYIKLDTNSLKRFSNFHIAIQKIRCLVNP